MTTTTDTTAPDRLFSGCWPAGISYSDRHREQHGDYLKLAFLPFDSLELHWHTDDMPEDIRERIQSDADAIIARRGERYQITTSGQCVILGG